MTQIAKNDMASAVAHERNNQRVKSLCNTMQVSHSNHGTENGTLAWQFAYNDIAKPAAHAIKHNQESSVIAALQHYSTFNRNARGLVTKLRGRKSSGEVVQELRQFFFANLDLKLFFAWCGVICSSVLIQAAMV